MTYLEFVLALVLPLVGAISIANGVAWVRGKRVDPAMDAWPGWSALLLVATIGLGYTMPWDSYMIQSGYWSYGADRLSLVIAAVPIEEFAFVLLQTLLTGGWFIWLTRQPFVVADRPMPPNLIFNHLAFGALVIAWIGAVVLLGMVQSNAISERFGYLAWIGTWALPPLAIQVWFGADILLHYSRLVLTALLPACMLLSALDVLATMQGIWMVRDATCIGLGLHIPLEEYILFATTNAMLVFALTLILARESIDRFPPPIAWLMRTMTGARSRAG